MSTILPDQAAIVAITEVARSSIEGVDYAYNGYVELLKEAGKLGQSAETIKLMKNWADNEKFKLTNKNQPWDGKAPETNDYVNMLVNKANAVLPNIVAELKQSQVKLDIILDESVRLGFSVDKHPIASGTQLNEDLNSQLTAWMARNEVKSQGGVLYKMDELGGIETNINGQPNKANMEDIRQKITDPSAGFPRDMEDKGINLIVVQHNATAVSKPVEESKEVKAPAKIQTIKEAKPAKVDDYDAESTSPTPD